MYKEKLIFINFPTLVIGSFSNEALHIQFWRSATALQSAILLWAWKIHSKVWTLLNTIGLYVSWNETVDNGVDLSTPAQRCTLQRQLPFLRTLAPQLNEYGALNSQSHAGKVKKKSVSLNVIGYSLLGAEKCNFLCKKSPAWKNFSFFPCMWLAMQVHYIHKALEQLPLRSTTTLSKYISALGLINPPQWLSFGKWRQKT